MADPTPLRIYHLTRVGGFAVYDVAQGFVVRAKSNKEARKLCASQAGDEKADTWLSPTRSICVVLGYAFAIHTKSEIILRDFNAG